MSNILFSRDKSCHTTLANGAQGNRLPGNGILGVFRPYGVLLARLVKDGLNDLMPPRCLCCYREVAQAQAICENCWCQAEFITRPFCQCCGYAFENTDAIPENSICPACIAKKPSYTMARAAVIYNHLSRDLLMKFKHGDQQHLTPLLTRWLMIARHYFPPHINIDYVIPIPLHPHRLIKRRYNQAALLAKSLARQQNLSYVADMLHRIKPTRSQGRLTLKARRRNLRGAFEISTTYRQNLHGKSILIIDDVQTTGSTVEEAAKVLRKQGAEAIYVLTLARGIHPQKVD